MTNQELIKLVTTGNGPEFDEFCNKMAYSYGCDPCHVEIDGDTVVCGDPNEEKPQSMGCVGDNLQELGMLKDTV